MAIITLTTDWKSNDYYSGAVKGCILSNCCNANVIAINQQIHPFNVKEAVFVIKNSFYHFPDGTIHIVDVNNENDNESSFVAMQYSNHFFIGSDQVCLELANAGNIENIVQIELFFNPNCYSFPALYIFAPTAAFLACGNKISELGSPLKMTKHKMSLQPTFTDNLITGAVIYIDSYQNLITNITKVKFEQIRKGRKFEIIVHSDHYKITKINKFYNETSLGELLAVFNSLGLLEIAINKGKIAELLTIEIDAKIIVRFID